MKKLLDVEKLTDFKYLNMYKAKFDADGKEVTYAFCSRRDIDNLSCKGVNRADAVRVMPYIKKDNKVYAVLIKEFRYVVNSYVYGTTAGLIDDGEEPIESAKREIAEEMGASVKSIQEIQKMAYSTIGVTDETMAVFEAEVELNKKQDLDDIEDISVLLVDVDELLNFVDTYLVDYQSAFLLKMFYYKTKLNQLKSKE